MEHTDEASGSMVQDPRTLTDLGDFVDSMLASTKGTVRAERDYLTFMLAKRVGDTLRKIIGSLAAIVLYGLALLMASLCGAYLLGQELGNIAWGFAAVTGFYVLLGLVFGSLWKGSWGEQFTVNLINSFHGH